MVRATGVSIHDRARTGKLAEDSPLDMLMIRYNAAHPDAERDIFPHIPESLSSVIECGCEVPIRDHTGRNCQHRVSGEYAVLINA